MRSEDCEREKKNPSIYPSSVLLYCVNVLLSQCSASRADMDWMLSTFPAAVGEAIYLQGGRRVLAN